MKPDTYVVVPIKKPIIWPRNTDETWVLNPPRQVLATLSQASYLPAESVGEVSPLKTSGAYKQLTVKGADLWNKTVLVERNRDRGLGDLLFMTGPLAYLKHISGESLKIHMYGLTDRAQVLAGSPLLDAGPMAGPVYYSDLPLYDYHWFVEHVTEYDCKPDQLNVYDALYTQLGLNPEEVPETFKCPQGIVLTSHDQQKLNGFYYTLLQSNGFDARKRNYCVVAPTCTSSLRSANYSMWLEVIKELAKTVVVLVTADTRHRVPETDMTFQAFRDELAQIENVVDTTDSVKSSRLLASIIARSAFVVCLDSAPLYLAQAFKVPAVSLWGAVDPRMRIGYSPYMRLAVWKPSKCPFAPCFAQAGFPKDKCPDGEGQKVCEVLNITPQDVFDAIAKI